MEKRALGHTGLQVPVLGFGCGNVGGLMIRGSQADQERAVARALELGIDYFDTAPSYGDGQSETNLGRALRALGVAPVVGTKFRVPDRDPTAIGRAVAQSAEASLRRMGRDRVDLFQLHNPLAVAGLDAAAVLDQVVPACERLRDQGKIGFWGMSATGETAPSAAVVESGRVATAQVVYNLINSSAGGGTAGSGQDYGGLLDRAAAAGVGVLVIRVLAGGAASGFEARHPIGSPAPPPIGSGADYRADVAQAAKLRPLVAEGHAADLVEASLRFAIAHPAVSTVLVGLSSLDQLEHAAAAVAKGPLPAAALARLASLGG